MTDPRQDPTTAGDELARFRDDFGAALVSAARAQEAGRVPSARPRRPVGAAIGLAAAAATAVLVVTALPSPGDHDAPLLGASPAEAAVERLQRSLQEGVLVRRAETTAYGRTVERTVQEDWTDLADRSQHVRVTAGDPRTSSEYWNPSEHERWTLGSKRTADGRIVVAHDPDMDASNTSSARSPAEEVDELLRGARDHELVVTGRTTEGGERTVVVERRERCFATPDGLTGECPDPEKPSAWPAGAPAGMRPVTNFETWWIQEGRAPKILRYEGGAVPRGTTRREVTYRIRYTRWDVLPSTEKTRALVRVPAFPASRFEVVEE